MSYVEFNKSIGDRIMMLRIANHLSRERLAEMADISTKFLYEVENGKKGCSAYVLYRLATALGIKSDYVMNGGEDL